MLIFFLTQRGIQTAITELNPKDNFDSWDASKLKEIKKGNFSKAVGKALYENEEIVLWEIILAPFERLPFKRFTNNYSCTFFATGLVLCRNVNGRIILARLEKGDNFYWDVEEKKLFKT